MRIPPIRPAKHHTCSALSLTPACLPACLPQVGYPMLVTLRCMHKLGIIHRDIKLENLFINERNQVMMGDFGLALCMYEERAISPVGTLEYMAPEVGGWQAAGRRAGWTPGSAVVRGTCPGRCMCTGSGQGPRPIPDVASSWQTGISMPRTHSKHWPPAVRSDPPCTLLTPSLLPLPTQVLRLPSSELVMNGTIRPEDIPGVNEKVDIWSLGVTIFELVTGRSPFDGSNKEEIKANIIHHKMRPFPSFISKDCADFIMQVGGKEPACAASACRVQQH